MRSILWRLTSRFRRKRKSPKIRQAEGHPERVTVMLVPTAARGKPLQFQTTKRMLLSAVGLGAGGVVVAVLALTYIVISLLSRDPDSELVSRRERLEMETRLASRENENLRLRGELKAHVRETQDRIDKANRWIRKISEFTGLPLDAPITTVTATTLTSGSASSATGNGLGRGGPLVPGAGSMVANLLGHGPDSYRKIREIQVAELDSVVVRLERAARHFGEQQDLLKTTPLICPVQGEYVFTDRFGNRVHPMYRREDFHNGLDVAATYKTPIIAPADGEVTYAGYDKSKGRTLTIDHGVGVFPRDGVPSKRGFKTRYFHCDKILVKKGVKVKRGDVIALVGSTGTSTGNHLHYEVYVDDDPVDPEFFILNGQ